MKGLKDIFQFQVSPRSNGAVSHFQYIARQRCRSSGPLLGILLIVYKIVGSLELSLQSRSPLRLQKRRYPVHSIIIIIIIIIICASSLDFSSLSYESHILFYVLSFSHALQCRTELKRSRFSLYGTINLYDLKISLFFKKMWLMWHYMCNI
jgi:hypothetical protein